MRSVLRFASPLLVCVSLAAFGGQSDLRPPPADDTQADIDEPAADDDATQNDDDDDPAAPDSDDGAGDDVAWLAADAGKKHVRPRGGCSSNMARVSEFCIDRYEAPNRRGARPLVMQSANDAIEWCSAHHKRLCTEDEWISACQGEEHRPYPYGSEHVEARCNDDKPWRKVDEATLAKWPSEEARAHAKELYQATPSGYKRKCASETGVRDLTGNVEEWVTRTREHANDWPYLLIGCYWSGCYGGGKPTCHSTNDAHGPEFRFYETGFRCCRDAGAKRPAP